MMKMMEVAAVAVLIVGGASAASAENWNGAAQIARGDYAAAERIIVREQRLFPRDTDLLINLATVYARTGRVAEARRTYALAAAQPDEALEVASDRTVSSRRLATNALRMLDREVAALR